MSTATLMDRLNDRAQRLEIPTEQLVPAGNALARTDSDYIGLTDNALDMIRENLKDQPLSLELFDLVKSPTGGSTVFTVPGMAGDEVERELTGIILDFTTPRAYWATSEPVEGTLPTCMSVNSVISQDGKACALCPYNDFGSKDGESNAKACKESVLLFLLRPNTILPLLVRIPATSKGRFLKYTVRLAGMMIPVNGVVTKITLERATSKAGKPFALFNFEAITTLNPDETTRVRAYASQFIEIVKSSELVKDYQKAG